MRKKIFIFSFSFIFSLMIVAFAVPARADINNVYATDVIDGGSSCANTVQGLGTGLNGTLTGVYISVNCYYGTYPSSVPRVDLQFCQFSNSAYSSQDWCHSDNIVNTYYPNCTIGSQVTAFVPFDNQVVDPTKWYGLRYNPNACSYDVYGANSNTFLAGWYNMDGAHLVDSNKDAYFQAIGLTAPPTGVPLTIDTPPDNSTIQGLSVEIAGACDNNTGTSTDIYVSNNYIPDFSPYFSGHGTCSGNRYTLGFQVQQYGTYTFTVSHGDERTDTASITLTFSEYASGGSWLGTNKFVANLSSTSTVPISNPWIIDGDDGYNINDVPVYFHFSSDVISASSTYIFLLQNTTSTSSPASTVLYSTVFNMGLTGGNYIFHVNFSTTTPQNYHAQIRHTGGTGWDQSDEISLHFFPVASIGDVYDFGNYFPKLKAVLEKKILFAQYFQMYDSLTGHFNTLSGTTTPFSAKMYVMTDNNTFTKNVDVFNLDQPVVKSFSNPIRPFFVGLLWILFAVYVIKKLWDLAKNLRV